jgi:cell volume regulation protein A
MDNVSIFLLAVAGIFLIGVGGEMVFRRSQVPDAVWLVLAGVIAGPVTGLLRQDLLRGIAPFFAALTLIVILFDGGRRLRVEGLMRSIPAAAGVAFVSFTLSSLAVAALAHGAAALGWIPAPWTLLHSILLGVILGGSSSVVIMPSMAIARVEGRVAEVLNLEAAITDILCVVAAATVAQLILRGLDLGAPFAVVARTFAIGLGIGAAAGAIWILFLGLLHQSDHGFALTLSTLLIVYVVADQAGGSAALAVLTFAVMVGNAAWVLGRFKLRFDFDLEPDGKDFHGHLVFIVKSFFFTFIGAMLGPPWGLAILGLVIGLALLPVRLPASWLAGWSLGLSRQERGIVAVALPRGLAAGVLATLPHAAGVPGTAVLPSIVFPAVVMTILVFSFAFPRVRRGAGGLGSGSDAASQPPRPQDAAASDRPSQAA